MTDVVMRAKFQVSTVHVYKNPDGTTQSELVHMHAVARSSAYPDDGSDEDNTYARWSPSGSLTLSIANPALFGRYKAGDKTYMDFTPAAS